MEDKERIQYLFFYLLRTAIGSTNLYDVVPSSKEWLELFGIAKKHSLLGICFVGVQIMKSEDSGLMVNMPETLYLKWLGMAAKIRQKNEFVNKECIVVCRQLNADGFKCCVLKGQGNIAIYGFCSKGGDISSDALGMYRTPGDIDVWVNGGAKKVVPYVLTKSSAGGYVELGYHHSVCPNLSNTEVELHNRPSWMSAPLRNWRMQEWFKEQEDRQLKCSLDSGFASPSADFNAVYQLCHIFNHLFEEGIGLRQLLDYYFVLRALHVEQCSFSDRTQSMAQWAEGMGLSVASNVQIMHTISRFGLKKFAGAVMFVLQRVFAMPDVYLLCPTDEREGCFLLNEILLAGNFGQYDERARDLHKATGISRKLAQLKHSLRLLQHYPEETLCTPFRAYHFLWKKLRLWRFERK